LSLQILTKKLTTSTTTTISLLLAIVVAAVAETQTHLQTAQINPPNTAVANATRVGVLVQTVVETKQRYYLIVSMLMVDRLMGEGVGEESRK
jgi:hypothetical protein